MLHQGKQTQESRAQRALRVAEQLRERARTRAFQKGLAETLAGWNGDWPVPLYGQRRVPPPKGRVPQVALPRWSWGAHAPTRQSLTRVTGRLCEANPRPYDVNNMLYFDGRAELYVTERRYLRALYEQACVWARPIVGAYKANLR